MKGFVSEEALAKYSSLAAEKLDLDFSEGEVYDFARCMRPDGSFYGTRGTCKKGSPAGEKEAEAPKAPRAPKAAGGRKRQETSPVSKGPKSAAAPAPAAKPKADIKGLKADYQSKFDAAKAARAAARQAEKNWKQVDKETKGDKSPEARQRRLEAGRAVDKAQQAADRAERESGKAGDRLGKLRQRLERAKMSPAQRADERRIDKIIKERG